jgi:hypothetical protein
MGASGGICGGGGFGAGVGFAGFPVSGFPFLGAGVSGSTASAAAAGRAEVTAMNSLRVMEDLGVLQVSFAQNPWRICGELLPGYCHLPFTACVTSQA